MNTVVQDVWHVTSNEVSVCMYAGCKAVMMTTGNWVVPRI